MPRNSFKAVESIGRTLPDVEVTTTYGQPALKVRGKMFVCIASHKSAEPNTLVVMMDFADRDARRRGRPWHLLPGRNTTSTTRVSSSACHALAPTRCATSSPARTAS
jgi:hypothetical protein